MLKGYGDGNYGPNDYITRAELVTLLDRAMNYQNSASNTFEDLDDNWYTENVLKGVAAGIITGDQNGTDLIRPNDHLTREEAAAIFARVMGLDTVSAPSAGFVDQDKIADWATGSVNAMKAAGYVNGFEGSFNPTDNLTRAEAVTILDNIFSDLYQSAGEFTGEVEGSAVISSGDVTLKDAVVDGDLVIAEGVADGHVVLDNVTVRGKLIVRGGGINSVIIKGDSRISQVRVARQGAAVRLSVEGSSQVGTVVVDNGADTVRIEGTVETVSVQGASASVEVTGTVGSLSIADSAENAKVTVAADATVGVAETSASGAQLVVSGSVESVAVKGEGTTVRAESGATISEVTTEAANTTVEGAGTVGSVVAGEGSEGTVVDTSGTKVENAGSGSVSAGGETVAPGGSVTTPDSSTGGSGSGSGGGSTVVTTASVSTFAELKSALESDTITTVNVTGSITADDAIAVNKTVNVQSGVTLDVMGKKLSGSGTVVVQSGGTLKINANYNGGKGSLLPSIETIEVQPGGTLASQTTNADLTEVVFVGAGNDARIKTGASTTVTLGFADTYVTSGEGATHPTMTISGAASVPVDQTWYTMFDSYKEAIGIDMTVASGTLTVNGTLKATSANSTGSSLTIAEGAGLSVAAGGKLEIAKKAVVTVNGTATSEGDITGTGSFTAPGFVKVDNAWVKKFAAGLGTAESPYQISSLDEWKNISVVATEGLSFLLTDNLTLDSTESMLNSFSGTLDGGDHSVTLPQNPASAGKWCAFAERATGTIRNLIINHGSGEVIPFIGYASGASMTFDNVDICTPDSNVTCQMSTSDNNESAYMAHSNALKLTFKDCNNYLSYYNSGGANAYTSAFMGGYTTTSEPTTITFDNCWNYGDLLMSHASLFVGNGSQMENDTIFVTNSGNYGSIIGYSSAQPFAAISTSSLKDSGTLNAKNYNQDNGEIKVMPKLEGFTLTLGEDSKIVIGTPSDASGVDHYNLTYSAYGRVDEGPDAGTYLFNVVFQVSASGTTEHSKYTMVDVATAGKLGISVEGLDFKSTGSYDMMYAVSGNYLICDFGSYAPESVVLNNFSPSISATAVSAFGEILGFAKLVN